MSIPGTNVVRLAMDMREATRGRIVRTLLYHSISNDRTDPLAVSVDAFRRQLDIVAASGLSVVSGAEMLAMVLSKQRIRRSVCITFDDGFEDFATTALPALAEYGFPATAFVSTGLVGSTAQWSTWSRPRRFLDWDELRDLLSAKVEIGSHTVSHPRLVNLDSNELRLELSEPLVELQNQRVRYLNVIAYPYGDHSSKVRLMARSVGYSAGFAVGGLWGNRQGVDPFSIRRTMIVGTSTNNQLREILNGRDDWKRGLHRNGSAP